MDSRISFARSSHRVRGLRYSIKDLSAGRTTCMTPRYEEYLKSEAWGLKRAARIAMSGGKCECCTSTRNLQVHHLTYARIFNEDMEDLMTLCRHHHQAAENFVDEKILLRIGEVGTLRAWTLQLLRHHKPARKAQKRHRIRHVQSHVARVSPPSRNRTQETLLAMPWFVEALNLKSRKAFKQVIRSQFTRACDRNKFSSNCFALYDRKRPFIHKRPVDIVQLISEVDSDAAL